MAVSNPEALVFEPLGPDHAEELFPGLSDPAGYLFLPDQPPETLEALRNRYARQAVGRSVDGSEIWLNWMVRLRESASAVGCTQATIQGSSALLAYQLVPAYWRRGFGSLAVRLTVEMLFSRAGIRDIRAFVDTRNQASVSLLHRLGFSVTQTIVGADHFKGADSDEHEFVMSRAEWQLLSPDDR